MLDIDLDKYAASFDVVFMEGGVIVEEGTPAQVFASENPRTRKFLGTGY